MNIKSSKNILLAVLGLIIIVGFIAWQNKKPSEMPTVRLGIVNQPFVALAKVAIDEGYFKKEGINVEVSEFTAGKLALQALLGGSLDLITSGEVPITLATLNGEKLFVIGEISQDSFPMILRKEGETTFDPQKYFAKKRKIATSIGGGPEFFTANFFKKYNIGSSQYEIISMQPQDMPIALANSSVDGIAIFEPFTSLALQKIGVDKVFVIDGTDLYSEIAIISGKQSYVSQNQKTIERFLSALQKSEDFVKRNPDQTIKIMSEFTKLDPNTLKNIWPSFILHLGLSQNLISTMTNEAQWAKDVGKVKPETIIPNFRNVIFDTPLQKISPSAVQL